MCEYRKKQRDEKEWEKEGKFRVDVEQWDK